MTYNEFITGFEKCLNGCSIPYEKKSFGQFTDFVFKCKGIFGGHLAVFRNGDSMILGAEGKTVMDRCYDDVTSMAIYNSDNGIVFMLDKDDAVLLEKVTA